MNLKYSIPFSYMMNSIPPNLVLYADDAILVINKPAGMLSLQDGYDKTLPHITTVLSPTYGRIWMIHRLDRETSGVMVVARSAQAHQALNGQFKDRQVQKIYHCLAWGSPDWAEKNLEVRLKKDGDRQHRSTIDPRGKPSTTFFRVLERYPGISLIEASPHTGYTHQIRAHLAYLGFPLVGDDLYRDPHRPTSLVDEGQPKPGGIDRVALHALSIQFIHPLTHTSMAFSAPYPEDFSLAVQQLRSGVKPH